MPEQPEKPTESGPAELPPFLVDHLQGGQSVVVATVDAQGRPLTTFMSWVVARDACTIALCVLQRSQTMDNLRMRPDVALEILGDGILYGVTGRARILKEEMETVPFPACLVEVEVESIKEHGNSQVIFQGPSYRYVEGKEHRYQVEKDIFQELRQEGEPASRRPSAP